MGAFPCTMDSPKGFTGSVPMPGASSTQTFHPSFHKGWGEPCFNHKKNIFCGLLRLALSGSRVRQTRAILCGCGGDFAPLPEKSCDFLASRLWNHKLLGWLATSIARTGCRGLKFNQVHLLSFATLGSRLRGDESRLGQSIRSNCMFKTIDVGYCNST